MKLLNKAKEKVRELQFKVGSMYRRMKDKVMSRLVYPIVDSTTVRLATIALSLVWDVVLGAWSIIALLMRVTKFIIKLPFKVIAWPFRMLASTRPVKAVMSAVTPILLMTRDILRVFAAIGLSFLVMAGMYKLVKGDGLYRVNGLPPYVRSDSTNTSGFERFEAMIRLYDYRGNFFCSATVISNRYAITAAHCFADKDRARVVSSDMYDTEVDAELVGKIESSDLAIVIGDFKEFKKLAADVSSFGLMGKKGPFMTCGFPYGENPVCMNFQPMANAYFMVQGRGALYPGMSGGPVVDANSGQLVGVNSRVGEQSVMVAPLIGLFNTLRIQVIQ